MSLTNHEGRGVPEVSFRIRQNNEWKTVTTSDIFAGKTVVVFSLPGAFTILESGRQILSIISNLQLTWRNFI